MICAWFINEEITAYAPRHVVSLGERSPDIACQDLVHLGLHSAKLDV